MDSAADCRCCGRPRSAPCARRSATPTATRRCARTAARFDSPDGYHPDHTLVAGVEISSGSLGHGLPIALGMTLALEARRQAGARVVCLVGDAELDEGSNWEAVQLAGRLGLGRLTVVVVDNRSSTYHWPDGVGARCRAGRSTPPGIPMSSSACSPRPCAARTTSTS
ncbi:MAG TPA: thiamine pyrophosphate-dependent enzyme [Solirubrobacteraceae bacterium]|nr:thiamine pyrophosphate-dependent enzyme [Solirubrobacteraceae bacterium]